MKDKIVIMVFLMFVFILSGCTSPMEQMDNLEKHNVTFVYDEDDTLTKAVNHLSTIPVPETKQKDGYQFDGWFTSINEKWVFSGYLVTTDITLYARYTLEEYTITLDDGAELTVHYHESFNLPNRTKDGYRFLGWIDSTGGFVDPSSFNYTSDQTFTPLFGPLFTISFISNGGSSIGDIEYYSTKITQLPTPTLEGLHFVGWKYNDKFITLPYVNSSLEDMLLIAEWSEPRRCFAAKCACSSAG